MQEQTSWSSTVEDYFIISKAQTPTYVKVLLFLFTHCRWMNTSTARQECATLNLYTTSRTTDTAPMLSFAGWQNSTVPFDQESR